jgi:hypothetical protein
MPHLPVLCQQGQQHLHGYNQILNALAIQAQEAFADAPTDLLDSARSLE